MFVPKEHCPKALATTESFTMMIFTHWRNGKCNKLDFYTGFFVYEFLNIKMYD